MNRCSLVAVALAVMLAPGCARPNNPAVSSANFDKLQTQLDEDQDVRLKDMEAMLGPSADIDPTTTKIPLPAEAQTDTTLKWKVWEDTGNGNRIVASFSPDNKLQKLRGVFRK